MTTQSTADWPATGETFAPELGTVVITGTRPYGEGEPTTIVITDGVITAISPTACEQLSDEQRARARIIDAPGTVCLPGLVDMHVHLREPGREDTETLVTGSQAAAAGGFTAVFTMANTNPVTDQPIIAESVWAKGQRIGLVDVHPVGSITKDLAGATLTEFAMMKNSDAKVRMFSDDGRCVDNPLIMRRAIEYAAGEDVLLAQHCEDHTLTEGACAHEGPTAGRLGLRGWPRVAEESIVIRDALMARDYGGRVHVCHASTAGTVELLRFAKNNNMPISAEVAPHHLLLNDTLLETFDGVYRVNPPLREGSDAAALKQGLLDGTIDCVATDHAPHGAEDKACEFDHARPGMLGLETSLAIIAKLFVETGDADWRFVAKVMSENPAAIVRLPGHGRPVAAGEPANLTLVDPDSPWTVDGQKLNSKSSNTPYQGHTFNAKVTHTILRGRVTCDDGRPVAPHTGA